MLRITLPKHGRNPQEKQGISKENNKSGRISKELTLKEVSRELFQEFGDFLREFYFT